MTGHRTLGRAAETMRREDEPVFTRLADWLDDAARDAERAGSLTGDGPRITARQPSHAVAVASAYRASCTVPGPREAID